MTDKFTIRVNNREIKTIIVVLTTMLCVASTVRAQWVFLADPFRIPAGWAESFAGDTVNLLSGGNKGLALSTDNGLIWNLIDTNIFSDSIGKFKVLANISTLFSEGKNIFLGWDNLYHSSDYGYSWKIIDSAQISVVLSIAKFGSTMLADCEYTPTGQNTDILTILLSKDNGLSWTPSDSGLQNYRGLINSFTFLGNKFFAGGDGGSIFTSIDGLKWERMNRSIGQDVFRLTLKGRSLFAGTDTGIFRSNDTGVTWNLVYKNADSSYIYSFAIHDSIIFAADHYRGVIRSTDNGTTWQDVSFGLGGYINTLYASGNYLFAGTTTGIWRRPFSELEDAVATPLQINSKFNLSPNPITTSADFQFNALQQPAFFELFDALGRSLLRRELPAGQASFHVDMQQYPAGIYFARLGGESVKVIKN
jgi:photosystem II stability/assembly factor-like uncharacterized protein